MAEVFVDEHGPAYRSHGVVHRFEVTQNDDGTGWLLAINGFTGSATCNLPQEDAEQLALMFLNKNPSTV